MGAGGASAPVAAGSRLGRYRLTEELGRGGMGIVFRAIDDNLQRTVAIKVLPTGTFDDDVARKLFRNEARALSALSHPNIAVVHDFDCFEGVDFLVLEHIDGQPLDQRIKEGSLAEKEVREIGLQLARALSYAHRHGVIHRDLKPANMMLTRDGLLKVLDFGLAKRLRSASVDSVSERRSPDATAHFVGTLHYVAPEQLRGERVDERADLYSFGATLYHLAAGRVPFQDHDAARLITAILERDPKPPSHYNKQISAALDSLILGAMAKTPSRRFKSAEQIAVVLEGASSGAATKPSLIAKSPFFPAAIWVLGGVLFIANAASIADRAASDSVSLRSGARVEISSEPSGALILIDGEPSGLYTPASIGGLPAGRSVQIGATKSGFAPAFEAVVTDEKTARSIALILAPLSGERQ